MDIAFDLFLIFPRCIVHFSGMVGIFVVLQLFVERSLCNLRMIRRRNVTRMLYRHKLYTSLCSCLYPTVRVCCGQFDYHDYSWLSYYSSHCNQLSRQSYYYPNESSMNHQLPSLQVDWQHRHRHRHYQHYHRCWVLLLVHILDIFFHLVDLVYLHLFLFLSYLLVPALVTLVFLAFLWAGSKSQEKTIISHNCKLSHIYWMRFE